jgi:hypothetical protein
MALFSGCKETHRGSSPSKGSVPARVQLAPSSIINLTKANAPSLQEDPLGVLLPVPLDSSLQVLPRKLDPMNPAASKESIAALDEANFEKKIDEDYVLGAKGS